MPAARLLAPAAGSFILTMMRSAAGGPSAGGKVGGASLASAGRFCACDLRMGRAELRGCQLTRGDVAIEMWPWYGRVGRRVHTLPAPLLARHTSRKAALKPQQCLEQAGPWRGRQMCPGHMHAVANRPGQIDPHTAPIPSHPCETNGSQCEAQENEPAHGSHTGRSIEIGAGPVGRAAGQFVEWGRDCVLWREAKGRKSGYGGLRSLL